LLDKVLLPPLPLPVPLPLPW